MQQSKHDNSTKELTQDKKKMIESKIKILLLNLLIEKGGKVVWLKPQPIDKKLILDK